MYKVRLLILPKFDGVDFTGDASGEARLFMEQYLEEHDTFTIPGGKRVFYNGKKEIALGLCGVGKIGAASYVTALFSDRRFDFSEAYILCVGCGGSARGYSTMGDVCLVSEAVNYDLGFEALSVKNDRPEIRWFHNDIFRDSSHVVLNRKLVDELYEKVRDIRLNTTAITRKIMAENFPGEEWALRDPCVIIGTAFSSDVFWKGEAGHDKAVYMNEFFGCREPFAITEMEDAACALVAGQFGYLDRLIILRASVNLDVFKEGETPESIWQGDESYIDRVQSYDREVLDIFPVGMDNLFRVGSAIIDYLLSSV